MDGLALESHEDVLKHWLELQKQDPLTCLSAGRVSASLRVRFLRVTHMTWQLASLRVNNSKEGGTV